MKALLIAAVALATFSIFCGVVASIAWWAWALDAFSLAVVALIVTVNRLGR